MITRPVMLMALRIAVPTSLNRVSRQMAVNALRRATKHRSAKFVPGYGGISMGTMPTESMVANNVTNLFNYCANMIFT